MGSNGADPSERSADPWLGRRVVVTGSSGFIGRHVSAALRARGAAVHEIHGRADCDLRDATATQRRIASARPEAVVHLAANPDQPDPSRADETVMMTANLLDSLRSFGSPIVVHSGSYKQYGDARLPFREDAPAQPTTAYGKAKHTSEGLILAASAAGRIRGVCLRIGPVYGPSQSLSTLVPTLLRHVLGLDEGDLLLTSRLWDPVYISDASDALLGAGTVPEAWGQIINVSGGVPYLPADILSMVADLAGADPRARSTVVDDAVARPTSSGDSYGDTGKAAAVLGWRPTTTLREGLGLVIDTLTERLLREHPVKAPVSAT